MVTILTENNLVYQRQTKYYTALEKWSKCRVPAYSKPLKIVYDSKPSLAKQAHERIIGLILNGEFSSGFLLHECKLAEFLGIFRTSVRDALMWLTTGGVVGVHRGVW